MKADYEQAATVVLTLEDGEVIRLSAILQRDPHHLTWNRIRLLGTETEKFSLWQLEDKHDLRWSLFANAHWPMTSPTRPRDVGFCAIEVSPRG